MGPKVLFFVGFLLVTLLVSTCCGDVRCLPKSSPPGSIQYCRYNDELVTWEEAERRCRKRTSTLAMDRDRRTHTILRKLMERYSKDPVWIAGRTGRWAWRWILGNGTVSPLMFERCYYAEIPVTNRISNTELLPQICRNYNFKGTSQVAKRFHCLCYKTVLGLKNPRYGSYEPKCEDYKCRNLYNITTVNDLPVTFDAHHRTYLQHISAAYHKDAMCLAVTAVNYKELLFVSLNCERKLPAIYHSKINENRTECSLFGTNAFYCIGNISTSWSKATLMNINGLRRLAVLDSLSLGQLAVLLINKENKNQLFWVSATNYIWSWPGDSGEVTQYRWADPANAMPIANVCMVYLRSGLWSSLMCSKKRHYICQKRKGSPKIQTFPRYMYFVIIIIMAAITIPTALIIRKVRRQCRACARRKQTAPIGNRSQKGLSLVPQTTDQEGGYYETINSSELTHDKTTGSMSLNGSTIVESELYEESSEVEIYNSYYNMETHESLTHYQEIGGDNTNHQTDDNIGSTHDTRQSSPSDNKTGYITDMCRRKEFDDIGFHRCSSVYDDTFLVDNDIYE